MYSKEESGTTYSCWMISMYLFSDTWFPGFHTQVFFEDELYFPKQSKSWTPSEREHVYTKSNKELSTVSDLILQLRIQFRMTVFITWVNPTVLIGDRNVCWFATHWNIIWKCCETLIIIKKAKRKNTTPNFILS